jgi:hypothetical protein
MKHIAPVVGIITLVPLLMGAGGANPGIPVGTKIAGTQFSASVVLDPHEAASGTTTAKQASIRIYKDNKTVGGIFKIPAVGFPLERGCDLTLTETRFLFVPLISWIPESVVDQLFNDLGAPRNPAFEPVITRILNDTCTDDPANPTTSDGSAPGILSFQATIRFLATTPPP